MKISTGIDIVVVSRIEKAMKSESFLERFFSEEECRYFREKGNHPQTVAGHFAAKEAFSKALGTGIRGFSLHEAAVLHDEWGAPHFELCGKAQECAAGWQLSLSISHDGGIATAVVMALRTE